MKKEIIFKNIQPFLDRFKHDTGADCIVKSGIEYGCPKEILAEISDKKERESLNNQVLALTTIGWRMDFKNKKYGDFIIIYSVAEDEEGAEKLTKGDNKLDINLLLEAMNLLKTQIRDFKKSKIYKKQNENKNPKNNKL